MKTIVALMVCLLSGVAYGQFEKSGVIDSLITSHLGPYSHQIANPVVLSTDEHPTIAFFEIQYLDSVEATEESFLDMAFRSRPAISLVQLLTFDEASDSFKKRTVDTLDVDPGGGGCHYLEVVDSAALIHHDNSSSLVLLMCHPVWPTCSSMTSFYFKSYRIDPNAIFNDIVMERIEHSRYDLYDTEQQKKAFQQLKWKKSE